METVSNRWVGLAYKWLMPLALAAAVGVAAVTVISAGSDRGGPDVVGQRMSEGEDQGEDGDCEGGKGHGKHGARLAELAALVGTDVDGLKSALGDGETLAEIAESNGVEAQTVIDAMVERVNERIDAAVEAGKLTSDEADAKRSEAAARIEEVVNNGFDRENLRGWGKGRWRGHGGGIGGSGEGG